MHGKATPKGDQMQGCGKRDLLCRGADFFIHHNKGSLLGERPLMGEKYPLFHEGNTAKSGKNRSSCHEVVA
jgi:hypothetical protein